MEYIIAIVLGFIIANLFSFIIWALYQLIITFFGISESGFGTVIILFYFASFVLFPYLIYKHRKNKKSKKNNSIKEIPEFIYCKSCGKKIDIDSKFCRYCRTKVELIAKE